MTLDKKGGRQAVGHGSRSVGAQEGFGDAHNPNEIPTQGGDTPGLRRPSTGIRIKAIPGEFSRPQASDPSDKPSHGIG